MRAAAADRGVRGFWAGRTAGPVSTQGASLVEGPCCGPGHGGLATGPRLLRPAEGRGRGRVFCERRQWQRLRLLVVLSYPELEVTPRDLARGPQLRSLVR